MTMPARIYPDYPAIKARQNAAWASGDYSVIGTTLQIVGEELAEEMDFAPGTRILDVAAGNGNATLAFARRWHAVTSTDYVQTLLDKGRARAEAEGLLVDFQIADAEAMPFADDSFDGVVSTFGVMFAPDQRRAVRELLRVCRPGGKIGLANWTPDSFIGQLFKTLGGHVAPPRGVESPALWGKGSWLQHMFADAAELRVMNKSFRFRYLTPEHFIDVFRTLYGPVHKAFQSLDGDAQNALRDDILALVHRFNDADDGTLSISGEYAEVIVTR